ncbi:hypothetical protein TWF694_003066 [Orbilia ellipsospora]|uniref:Nephrocystin 3-like N-terminal domain-containing protein n=1 Tax=Orbilia ellipsospora TaxID=2528407 RepID=A0AAV9X0U6_9PEZI
MGLEPNATDPSPPKSSLFTNAYRKASTKFAETTGKHIGNDATQRAQLTAFLAPPSGHDEFEKLRNTCEKLSGQAEGLDQKGKAARLIETLGTIKTVGDGVISAAPETVSIVWFGISSLISIATVKLEIRIMICDTCESISEMIQDCLRWEGRTNEVSPSARSTSDSGRIDIWDSAVPELLGCIFDFLWHARPHRDANRLQRAKSTIKETFTKELQAKVENLLKAHEKVIRLVQAHFEDAVFEKTRDTEERLKRISENMKGTVSSITNMLDQIEFDMLCTELARQRDKLPRASAHTLHFQSLNDRASLILEQRRGHLAEWFFDKEAAYKNWKAWEKRSESPMLCLESPRGHGKSMLMLCLKQRLEKELYESRKPIILSFFFKQGDQNLQDARTALQTILRQLLDRDELLHSVEIVGQCVEILNPRFGKHGENADAQITNDLAEISSLSETIRKISILLPRVYIMLDALDECIDRQEKGLVPLVVSMANPEIRICG